ncbi:MAG TPA: ABC transporter ATP-binding protein [Chloroflexota bacterium]|nr:ABC transporter ATP-binding protein [Chloroflexota bacterium]
MTPKMRLERATRTFLDGEVVAFQDLDLEIRPNESLCVVGPSGCGKTTLLRCLAGLIQPTEGNVYLDGQPVKKPSPNVVMVFQHFGLFPWKTVFDNVAYGLKLRGTPKAKWAELVRPHLELVGLGACEDLYPYQLSGGMQQRAGLARALVLNPAVLLMDEPFGSLDAQTRELLQEELARILEREQRTLVFITHSIDEAIVLGDRIVVMSTRPGRVREILDVDVPRPRDLQATRHSQRYAELRQHIWAELRPEVAAA